MYFPPSKNLQTVDSNTMFLKNKIYHKMQREKFYKLQKKKIVVIK